MAKSYILIEFDNRYSINPKWVANKTKTYVESLEDDIENVKATVLENPVIINK
ncbi:hypothetical protein [Paenibacillus illinoisensis]|uniref:hypothetical protein n=1 Tax=Paenibacillus illinoisensis TaxID=59845 RepID=UPI003016B56D